LKYDIGLVERAHIKAEDKTRYFFVVAIVSHVSEKYFIYPNAG